MLPPGHIAAGYLTGVVVLKIINPGSSVLQTKEMLMWFTFFGFAPDLDMFWIFFLEKAFIIKDLKNHSHRKLWSHAPILWLVAGLSIYGFATAEFFKVFGLAVWLGSWSHFLIDSIEHGIMWGWPFSNKVFALKNRGLIVENKQEHFFQYWLTSVKAYTHFVSFYLEILVIISALIVFFR